MDPILTGGLVVGGGYLLLRRGEAVPASETQPEDKGPVIPDSKAPLPNKAAQAGGAGLGAALGALTGKALADLFLDVTAGYNAPTTKGIAVPVLIGASTVGGAIVVFVAITYGAIAAGYAGLIVVAVLAIVFSAFVLAANVEDVDRWNAYVFHKQIVVKLVADGNFKAALIQANEGAKQNVPGLGFYLSPNRQTVYYHGELYYKTAFDTTPKIPAPSGKGYLNRGGLDHDYYFPTVTPYEYQTYFGKGGAHLFTRADGTQINMIEWMQSMYKMQHDAYVALSQKLNKRPTYQEWIDWADNIVDQNGVTLREYIALHDTVGAKIQPNVPWLDVYLLQSVEFVFEPGPGEQVKRHKRTYGTNDAISNINAGLGF